MNYLIKNCRLYTTNELTDILILNGKIAEIRPDINHEGYFNGDEYKMVGSKSDNSKSDNSKNYDFENEYIIEANGLTVAPSFIDLHVHLREPGFEYKEDIKTGTLAAARGGYTTIFCMPNTNPVIDDVLSLDRLKDGIEKDAIIKVMPVAAVTKGLKGIELNDLVNLSEEGATAFSDDGRPVFSDEIFEKALVICKEKGYIIFDHCEDLELVSGGVINEGLKSKELGLKGISAESEIKPILRDILIAKKTGARIHICHVSAKGSVEAIRTAKADGVRITCEAAPHHIALDDSIVTAGYTDCKVNPPLRGIEDREAIVAGIIDGTIDIIATDHAPHHETEKASDFYKSAFGISGIETAFTVCYDKLVKSEKISLERLVELMSTRPAEIMGLECAKLEIGFPADIVLLDVDTEITVDKTKFLSKGKNTPFQGMKLFGEVKLTMCKGRIVYNDL